MKPPVPVIILLRVSTDRQNVERQRFDLLEYARAHNLEVLEVLEETISGCVDEDKRHGLARALELAQAGTIRKVLVHEVSRLARRNSIVHKFVETLETAGVSLYWHAQSIETLLPSGKRNPAAAIMLALLSEMARAEIETLRERINSGLAVAKARGVTLGRPVGSGRTRTAFLAAHRDVVRLLRDGHSIRHTAAITGKGCSTVQRVKAGLRAA